MSIKSLDDWKILGTIIGCFVAFTIIFVVPWIYGCREIALKLFN